MSTVMRTHRWTTDAYEQIIACGVLDGKHVELIQGAIIDMPPMGSRHETAVLRVLQQLMVVFGTGYVIRPQMSLRIAPDTEPEPDVAVVAGHLDDYERTKPTTAVLIVEVAETSLVYNRDTKGPLYASAGISEYWIVNLPERCLEVYRQPQSDAASPTGWAYAEQQRLTPAGQILPLSAPQHPLSLDALLPTEP